MPRDPPVTSAVLPKSVGNALSDVCDEVFTVFDGARGYGYAIGCRGRENPARLPVEGDMRRGPALTI